MGFDIACIQPALGISGKCPASIALHISPVYEKRLRAQSLHDHLQCFRHLNRRGIYLTCIYSTCIYPIYTSLTSEIFMDRIVSFDIPHFACGMSLDLSGACILCCFFPDESLGAVEFHLHSDWDPWVILHPAYAAASGPNNMWLH